MKKNINIKKTPLSNKELRKREKEKEKRREKREELMWKIITVIMILVFFTPFLLGQCQERMMVGIRADLLYITRIRRKGSVLHPAPRTPQPCT